MNVWVDVDNPPQARYLLPLARRFERAGHSLLLTARDYGDTFAILDSERAAYEPVGASFGKGARRKLVGLARRTRQLISFLERQPGRPEAVVTASRSAAIAARRLGVPSFVIIDYEHVDLRVYRLSRSHIVFPSVIDARLLERKGIRAERLMPFAGLKEDIAFADVDFDAVVPHEFGDDAVPRVLFRPPAEESHYHRSESLDLALEVLRHLAAHDARVVFSPRYRRQVAYLEQISAWSHEPIVLERPVAVVALLKGVDAVVSAGGTMLREAAYLGVPAYSIFRGSSGAVDGYLASIGRLSLLESPADCARIRLARTERISPLRVGATAADEVMRMIVERSRR